MKNKIILLLTILALTSKAQLVTIDGLALHTNIAVTAGAQLTVIGLFTNDTYSASNHNYVTQGDAWQPTGISKINSNFSYISNQLVLLMNLPNQINTNMAANIVVISNGFIIVSNAFVHYLATNQFAEYMVTNLLPNYLATNPVGGKMNFDTASILSDGSGNITAVSLKSSLLDSSSASGSSGYVPTANGSGSWSWAAVSALPDITDNTGGPYVGIAQSSPAYTLDIGGTMNMTDIGSGNTLTAFPFGTQPDPDYTIGESALFQASSPIQFYGTSISEANNPSPVEFIANGTDNGGNSVRFLVQGIVRYEDDDSSATTILSCSPGSVQFDAPGTAGGVLCSMPFQSNPNDGWIGIQNQNPQYNLDVTGTMGDSVDGGWNIDGSGNITCLSLTQTSDQTTKTNFTPVNTAVMLASLQSLSVSNWTFKSRILSITNWQATFTSNLVVTLRTNAHGSILSRTNWVKTMISSNAVVKTRSIGGGSKHIGPMAQAWGARFGGGTNGINVTDAIGALLAGEQELAARCATNSPQTNATAIPIRSPNGTAWYLHVSNTGQVTADPTP